MNNKIIMTILLYIAMGAFTSYKSASLAHTISIFIDAGQGAIEDSMSIKLWNIVTDIEVRHLEKTAVTQPPNRLYWRIPADEPVKISMSPLKPDNAFTTWIGEPGDDITIRLRAGKLSFSGKGAEKYILWNELHSIVQTVEKPVVPVYYVTQSLTDFLSYSNYLDKQWKAIEPIIESYRLKISDYVFNYIKAATIHQLEEERAAKFFGLFLRYRDKGEVLNISNKQLANVYDSIFFSPRAIWMRRQPFGFVGDGSHYRFIRTQVLRKLNFPIDWSSENHVTEILEEGKRQFKDAALESFLSTALCDLVIGDLGINAESSLILDKYYKDLTIPAFREKVKSKEQRKGIHYTGRVAAPFSLKDENGIIHSNKTIQSKLTLLNFCLSSSENRLTALKQIWDIVKDTNLLMLNVVPQSFKNANWGDSFSLQGNFKYCTLSDSSLLKAYGVEGMEGSHLIGPNGKIALHPLPDPTHEQKKFISILGENLNLTSKQIWMSGNDGPYIIKDNDDLKVWGMKNNKMIEVKASIGDKFEIATDIPNKYFKVKLKEKNINEPSDFSKPEKLFAVSDIEGNFETFRKLLQANKIMDENFNWLFGKGHLVLVGDVVDRGPQVTECLWLIYMLEEKAKAAGGYVHFILGNHEIMNLSNDIRYVPIKNKKNALAFRKDYAKELYGPQSELGIWLRSKNIAEKIGDILFVHGGISEEILQLRLSLEKMNQIAKLYYDRDSLVRKSRDIIVSSIFNSKNGPFWHRLYFQADSVKVKVYSDRIDTVYKTPKSVIDAVLNQYQVSKIITGHTIYKVKATDYGAKISTHYNNKVINIDTRHSQDYSEGLLIEDKSYYRVDRAGNRVILFEPTD